MPAFVLFLKWRRKRIGPADAVHSHEVFAVFLGVVVWWRMLWYDFNGFFRSFMRIRRFSGILWGFHHYQYRDILLVPYKRMKTFVFQCIARSIPRLATNEWTWISHRRLRSYQVAEQVMCIVLRSCLFILKMIEVFGIAVLCLPFDWIYWNLGVGNEYGQKHRI